MSLLEQLGGMTWVRRIGADRDGPATAESVRLIIPLARSSCGANRLIVSAIKEENGGGFAVEWWKVSKSDTDLVREGEASTAAKVVKMVEKDLGMERVDEPAAA